MDYVMKMKKMTPRERVAAALRFQPVDQIPFLHHLLEGEGGDRLRELGVCQWVWGATVTSSTPNVKVDSVAYEEQGIPYRRNFVRTPVGEVYATKRLKAAYDSEWYVDHYIKRPEDYKVIEYMVNDTVYQPNYEDFQARIEKTGEAGYVSDWTGYTPLLEMEVDFLGIERFGHDQYDYPELFFSLYETLRKKRSEMYPIVADSPTEHVCGDANPSPEALGKRFAEYVIPVYNELGQLLHERGKLLGSHLDANNGYWREDIAKSQLDVIEAFTPAPNSDMTMAEARAAWPDKVIVINFPSSIHLEPLEKVKEVTWQILEDAKPARGLIMSCTEDIPPSVGYKTMIAIAEVLVKAGPVE